VCGGGGKDAIGVDVGDFTTLYWSRVFTGAGHSGRGLKRRFWSKDFGRSL
jgi:hypothetical protein